LARLLQIYAYCLSSTHPVKQQGWLLIQQLCILIRQQSWYLTITPSCYRFLIHLLIIILDNKLCGWHRSFRLSYIPIHYDLLFFRCSFYLLTRSVVYVVLFVSAILYFSSMWGFFYLFSKIFIYDFQYFFPMLHVGLNHLELRFGWVLCT